MVAMLQHIDDSKYSVHHRKEIIAILDSLKNSHAAIKLNTSYGEELITSMLGFSPEKNHAYLDVSVDEKVNSRIVDSIHVTFATQSGILVKWHSTHVSRVKLPDGTALSILVPAVIQRIQRREYFRLPIPQGSNGLVCRIPLSEEVLDVPIRDMSAGGIGIVLQEHLLSAFSQGAVLEGCNIEFPDIGMVRFKLKVCGTRIAQKTQGVHNLYHIGMEFMGLSRGTSNVVQRYMIQLEGEKISLAAC